MAIEIGIAAAVDRAVPNAYIGKARVES